MMSNYQCRNIKMVIWDLDETLWKGTISEGTVEIDQEKIEFIKYLNSKGIVNSICSKNDENATIDYLKFKKIEDLFIFPSINWNPKGQRIYEIIKNANLRPENVLFIDDNDLNLNEAVYYSVGIMTLQICDYIEFRDGLLSLDLIDNPVRLEQYRILEKKLDAKNYSSDNIQFLRSCNIKVSVNYDCFKFIDRILELINRTNQLNFTKRRICANELKKLLENSEVQSGYIVVDDNFGKYGLTGFYAMEKGELIHFLFSCRTMNMGVEQWVYRYLGKPKLKIIGEVSSDLEEYEDIDWISESAVSCEKEQNSKVHSKRFLFKGPCDISQTSAFINSSNITEEYTYISERNGASVFLYNHTEFIRQLETLSNDTIDKIINEIPFVDSKSFKTTIFDNKYDIVVLSLMVDYSLGIYRKKDGTYVLPLFQFTLPFTDKSHKHGYSNGNYYFQNLKYDEKFYEWFNKNFEYTGVITKERLVDNILYIKNKLGKNTQLILLNGSETACSHPEEWMIGRELLHKEYNQYIAEQLNDKAGITIIDVSKFIKSSDDYSDNINHFKKRIYYELAQEIINASNSNSELQITSKKNLKYQEIRLCLGKLKIKLTEKLNTGIFRKMKKERT